MTKRALSEVDDGFPGKKARVEAKILYNKVATAENAAAVDKNSPYVVLLNAVNSGVENPAKGEAVVYWMRMEDLRIVDNRAISFASKRAQEDGIPLIVLFVISPQDYEAHDRAPRRIDFMLRNLKILKRSLDELNIPLFTITHTPRKSVPAKVVSLVHSWNSKYLFANISYEVDELQRDIKTCELGREKGVKCEFIQDKLVINPGVLKTKDGRAYTVYSPWLKNWLATLNNNMNWISEAPVPRANNKAIRSSGCFSGLFKSEIPDFVKGFECADKDKMAKYWPAGTEAGIHVLESFMHKEDSKISRIEEYSKCRNQADTNTTSRLSPYLASGVISVRACIRQTMTLHNSKTVEGSRDSATGMWVQEVAWRDFYNHVMATFPRVSMGRPYLEKYSTVKWESNEDHLQSWKDGRTGVPIVDAAMRQLNEFGWMHNRCRMIVSMYLTKDLMLDWRLGEKYFMENLIDGDLASNNGGWQWSASTGTSPQPYFRIFNPASQSEKADPTGNYIRHYVPELAKLTGKAIHEPSAEAATKYGYPEPLVDHKKARDRALRRYKNPGEV